MPSCRFTWRASVWCGTRSVSPYSDSLRSGCILGQCHFTDIVFCHYSHRSKEVAIIAPSACAEPREKGDEGPEGAARFLLQSPQVHHRPAGKAKQQCSPLFPFSVAYFIYKQIHRVVMEEYKANTDALIELNKRVLSLGRCSAAAAGTAASEPQPLHHGAVLGEKSARGDQPSWRCHLCDARGLLASPQHVDLGGGGEALLRPHQHAVHLPVHQLCVPSSPPSHP